MTARAKQPMPGDRPVRTCVGCKVREVKSSLLRLVVARGEIVPDPSARLLGRGAYVHPSQDCLDLAQRRKAFPRAFRVPGPLGTGPLATYLAASKFPVRKAGREADERSMSTRR